MCNTQTDMQSEPMYLSFICDYFELAVNDSNHGQTMKHNWRAENNQLLFYFFIGYVNEMRR
jgi:hypothetical protein